ncbi:hypothetical protein DFA_04955 [Cavenderia fasciculata]|uniref:Paramecium surface antigen repeat-containing protein n=1 Tax=Cavenderia fasciculata TaxID=261658 RepID=F4PMM8_CACFS|nr:uncharacterized protein DFA_04955 [Cavenderia fasciculata]EGG22825.1 hypothetical protein DFA_04955 [Cavenderia fasciculata]|eukprot:XP_004360676.1 hypothetical protein DFA_04955 [Cavenderia fasciculata]
MKTIFNSILLIVIVLVIGSIRLSNGEPPPSPPCKLYNAGAKCQLAGQPCENEGCIYGTHCFNGTCVKNTELNGKCNATLKDKEGNSLECGSLFGCANQKCTIEQYLENGDACTDSYQCLGTLECTGGKCTLKNNTCKDSNDCPYDHYCNEKNHSCTPELALGDNCTQKSQVRECRLGSRCLNGKCVAYFSLKEGDPCLWTEGITIFDLCDIELGLYCDGNGTKKCEKIPSSATNESVNCIGLGCNPFEKCYCVNGSSTTKGTCHPFTVVSLEDRTKLSLV